MKRQRLNSSCMKLRANWGGRSKASGDGSRIDKTRHGVVIDDDGHRTADHRTRRLSRFHLEEYPRRRWTSHERCPWTDQTPYRERLVLVPRSLWKPNHLNPLFLIRSNVEPDQSLAPRFETHDGRIAISGRAIVAGGWRCRSSPQPTPSQQTRVLPCFANRWVRFIN